MQSSTEQQGKKIKLLMGKQNEGLVSVATKQAASKFSWQSTDKRAGRLRDRERERERERESLLKDTLKSRQTH